MIFNKGDYSSSKKDKNLNFSIDSSRTTSSISKKDSSDTIPLKTEIDYEEHNNLLDNSNKDNDAFNIKINQQINEDDNNGIKNYKKYFHFKLQLSLAFCIIYFLLFLISIPKRPIKKGHEKNLIELIKDNNNDSIYILLNDFNFHYDNNNKIENSLKNNENKTSNLINDKNIENKKNYELTGYLLDMKIDKIFILRWLIGFLYFIVRCICFIYSSKNNTTYFLHKIKYSSINDISCLIFPLSTFFYDLKNNITYINIKNEIFENKHIFYYIITEKHFTMIDYVEGIIPTICFFLLSLIYNGIEQSIGTYFRNRKKISKVI
jgi:hypothetical protein